MTHELPKENGISENSRIRVGVLKQSIRHRNNGNPTPENQLVLTMIDEYQKEHQKDNVLFATIGDLTAYMSAWGEKHLDEGDRKNVLEIGIAELSDFAGTYIAVSADEYQNGDKKTGSDLVLQTQDKAEALIRTLLIPVKSGS